MKLIDKDHIIKYGVLLNKRRTQKQKQYFIKAILNEIIEVRNDVSVISYKNKNHNIYVGDIENSDIIICTYYDTPAKHFFNYNLLDKTIEEKNVLKTILLESFILIGLAGFLIFYARELLLESIKNYTFALWIIFFYIYFTILKKSTIGFNENNNMIRNNSSVIYILNKILKDNKDNVSYAFLDEGCTNDSGLQLLLKKVNDNSKIIFLDSIGAFEKLYVIYNNEILEISDINIKKSKGIIKIVSAVKDGEKLYLNRKKLNIKDINFENMVNINKFLEGENL